MTRPTLPTALAAALALAALAGTPAFAKDTGNIYVSSEKDNAITVLDGKTYAVTKTIKTGKRPRDMRLSADRTQLYVIASDSKRMDIIDLAKGAAAGSVPVGEDPEMFDVSPDGKRIVVSNEEGAQLSVIDLATKKKVVAIKVGEEPEGVKFSPDGKKLYATSEVANMVHVIDPSTNKVVADVVAGNRPRRFAITPDGGEVWVTNELGASVTVVDGKANTVKATVDFKPKGFRTEDVTPVGIAMTKDGKTAYVTLGRANHVAVVDVATRAIKDYVLVGKRAWGATLNRAENRLFVVNGLSDDVSIVDTSNNKVIKSVPVGRVPHTVVVDD
jgi:PQQ-dependent catabolism-associated beta-propeller protein